MSVFTYKAQIENISNIPNIMWSGIYLYVWPSNPGKLPIAKIRSEKFLRRQEKMNPKCQTYTHR